MSSNSTLSAPALLLAEEEGSSSLNTNGESSSSSSITNVVSQVIVHPLVLMSILDHHSRRAEDSGRVVGTLLGMKHTTTISGSSNDSNGETSTSTSTSGQPTSTIVEITNSFAVPHAERGEEVAFGTNYNKEMLNLHLLANKKESVVGWYATTSAADGTVIVDTSSLVHEFYAGECDDGNPIHLAVDTTLIQDSLSIRAFQSAPVQVQGEPLANLFHEVRLHLQSSDAEAICLAQMAKTNTTTAEAETPMVDVTKTDPKVGLVVSMEKLLQVLEQASAYVDSVLDGKIPMDAPQTIQTGRHMADALATVPRIRPHVFDKLFNDSLQDLLMVTYLSNITKTQLVIAEKLNETLTV